MTGFRAASIRAGTVAVALAVMAAVALALMSAYSSAPGRGQLRPASGLASTVDAYLAIKAGSPDRIELLDSGGTSLGVQTISASATGCALVTSPADDTDAALLSFNGKVGSTSQAESWAPGSIGVREKKSGTSCYRVDAPGETLDVAIGPGARPAGAAERRFVARAANLDVELKQDARILATAFSGSSVVGYYELQSGSTIGTTTRPSGVLPDYPYAVQECRNPSDSGPDAGPRDNCRWAISVPTGAGADDGISFDRLSLRAVNGSFSLEYGRDGAVTDGVQASPPPFVAGSSYVELTAIDGILDCNAATVTRPDSGTAPEVGLRRLGNATRDQQPDGGFATTTGCSAVPYTLSNEPSAARFLKPLDQQATAQFVADFVWILPVAQGTTALPPTKVDFETPAAGDQVDIGWCPDPVYQGTITLDDGAVTSPKLVGIANPLSRRDLDEAPGVQFACLGSQSSRVVDGGTGPDTLRVVEQVYVLGDIRLQK